MLRKNPIALAIFLAHGLSSPAAHAQTLAAAATASAPESTLKEITVTATRTERRVDDVPATVTVTPASAIERSGARDIKDLFRNEIDIDRKSVV